MGVVWKYRDGNLSFGFENSDIPQIVDILKKNKELKGITTAEMYDLFMKMARFYEFAW